jgi:3-oxoacyl-[acyl-carrier-protein] synthase II
MAHRVVITGLGPVTSAGIGKEDFCRQIWTQRCHLRPIPASFTRTYPLRSRWYVPLPEVSLASHGILLPHEDIMQAADRMAVLGVKLALEDAGFAPVNTKGSAGFAGGANQVLAGSPRRGDSGRLGEPSLPPMEIAFSKPELRPFAGVEEAGLVLGASLGSMQAALESHLCHCLPREALQAALPERRLAFSRMVVPKTMPNSPAAWASICFGLSGPCHTVNASCASGTYAIGEAFRRIKDGYALMALAGGVESFQDPDGFLMRGFDVLGVLTQSADGLPRPFGRNRSGFLFAEGGACLLVLEELEHAMRRGARVYAEVADFQANSDASNIVQIDSTGKQITRLLGQLSGGRRIDYLNAHGAGTVANDQVETRAIQAVFGGRERQPLVNSTKGILGHTLGASGAIEAAVTALSIAGGTVHGNLTEHPMEDLNLPLENVTRPIVNAISVSYGFGGHNGGLLLTRYEPSRQERERPASRPT